MLDQTKGLRVPLWIGYCQLCMEGTVSSANLLRNLFSLFAFLLIFGFWTHAGKLFSATSPHKIWTSSDGSDSLFIYSKSSFVGKNPWLSKIWNFRKSTQYVFFWDKNACTKTSYTIVAGVVILPNRPKGR